MKMRICMIGPDPKVMGGISTVVKGYLSSSLSEEFDIRYISSHVDGSKFRKLGQAIKAYFKFIRVCICKSAEVVHIHSSFGPSFFRKAIFIIISRIFRVPTINHVHGAEFDNFYNNAGKVKKAFVRKIYNLPEITIGLSDEWVQRLSSIIPAEKLVRLENFAVVPEKYNSEKNENIVLFLGEVGKRKGAYDIPKVVEILSEEIQDISFILGGNGEVEKLNQIIKEKRLDKFMKTLGWVDGNDKKALLEKSKIYFLPSYNEGMPMSILEGMAFGLPVVSTTVGGIPTLIRNGQNGFTHEPGDAYGFASSIKSLLQDKEMYSNISKNNIEVVRKKYSLEASVSKLKEIYCKLGDSIDCINK